MKSAELKPKLNRQVLDEASRWFVDFRVGDIDSTARTQFDQWLRQSPEHIRAYMEIARVYAEVPGIGPELKVDVERLIAQTTPENTVVSLDPTSGIHSRSPADQASARRSTDDLNAFDDRATFAHPGLHRKRSRKPLLAAATVILCVLGGLAWRYLSYYTTYSTQIGERRSITLSDGSTVEMNARSTVRIRFSKTQRYVDLVDGQALFGVAKDKARPFIVQSDKTLVRALGTQFDVYRRQNGTTVTVIEGRVSILAPSIPAATPRGGDIHLNMPNPSSIEPHGPVDKTDTRHVLFLSAGERLTISSQAALLPEHTDVTAATAWVQRRLIFDASRLIDVVDDFNRYNARQLVVEDRQLDDFHISGVYSSGDPASLLRFLRSQPGINVIETGKVVRITSVSSADNHSRPN